MTMSAGEQVRRQHRQPRLREALGHLFGQPLDTGPHRGHPPFHPAGGAGLGQGLCRAALVADQPLQEPVFHHPRVAIVAADLRPAGPAQRYRRIAAAVARVSEIQRFAGRLSARMSIARICGSTAGP